MSIQHKHRWIRRQPFSHVNPCYQGMCVPYVNYITNRKKATTLFTISQLFKHNELVKT